MRSGAMRRLIRTPGRVEVEPWASCWLSGCSRAYRAATRPVLKARKSCSLPACANRADDYVDDRTAMRSITGHRATRRLSARERRRIDQSCARVSGAQETDLTSASASARSLRIGRQRIDRARSLSHPERRGAIPSTAGRFRRRLYRHPLARGIELRLRHDPHIDRSVQRGAIGHRIENLSRPGSKRNRQQPVAGQIGVQVQRPVGEIVKTDGLRHGGVRKGRNLMARLSVRAVASSGPAWRARQAAV